MAGSPLRSRSLPLIQGNRAGSSPVDRSSTFDEFLSGWGSRLSGENAPARLASMPSPRLAEPAPQPGPSPRPVRRRVSPVSGRAIEMLGHAIEYLADEYAVSVSALAALDAADPRIEAIQILMSLNRAVYYECPEEQPLAQRIWRKLLGRETARS